MMSSKRLAIAATGAAVALMLSACASVSATTTAQPTGTGEPTVTGEPTATTSPTNGTASPTTTAEPSPGGSSSSAPAEAAFGPGCASLPTDPSDPGSIEGMAQLQVGDAVAGNPMLSTLAAAVTEAGLVDTLNSTQNMTIFAPSNEAFEKIPESDLAAIMADPDMLQQILTYHVVPETLTQESLAGTHATVQGSDITVTGSGTDFTVNETAKVLCGNIKTQNGTLYIIDGVLTPS